MVLSLLSNRINFPTDLNECLDQDIFCVSGACGNNIGGYECDCPPNYTLIKDERGRYRCVGMYGEPKYLKVHGEHN